ncbi:MAG: PorP/SprF family type IX secretion system membrane protein [Bacteroidota bacterium]
MKKNIKIIGLLIATFLLSELNAQQTPQSNLYGFNGYSMNPAYAGASGCTEVYFSHLNQWVKVEGAPTTSLVSANSRIGRQLGLGANVLIDKLGMLQQVAASGTAAYGFKIAGEHDVRFGITAGYYQFRVNPEGAIVFDGNDVIVNGGAQSASSINSEVGFLYRFKGLEVSLASRQVIQSFSNFGYSGLDGYGLRRHMIGYMGYRFNLTERIGLKPSVFYKGINNVSQVDFNLDGDYRNLIHAGLGYRLNVGIIGRVGVNVRDLFFIGYGYEAPMQNIAKYSSGSHEVILGLKLCRRKKEPFADSLYNRDLVQEIMVDTIYQTIMDTLVVERIDTVFIGQPAVTDQEANRVLDLASKSLEFENDKAIILKRSYGELESLVNIMLLRPDLRIQLEGHTDNNGSEAYNLELSKNRVQAVKDFLVANGVNPDRIDLSFFGESKPIADNSSEEGRQKNRRVVMKYLQK